MKLLVVSIKRCWFAPESPSGFATDGGFPFQMRAIAELFDETTIIVPCLPAHLAKNTTPLVGHNVRVVPLPYPPGHGWRRKLSMPGFLLKNLRVILREMRRADAVHAPIPGDISTIGMVLALLLRKRLFVRYCGNWLVPKTAANRFGRGAMERYAGGRNVMLATGGAAQAPSQNPAVHWIFSTSLTQGQLSAFGAPREEFPGDAPRLILTGRQVEAKGTDIALHALAALRRDFSGAHLDVVGNGPDLDKFKALAARLHLEDAVTFHGEVQHDDVLPLLRRAHLFVFPTESEGFPKSVLEALAAGLPVVTSPVSVLPLLLSHGGGLTVERTPEAVAQAVRQCLRDAPTYRRFSQCAVETASGYSLEKWGETIGAHLQKAWGRTREKS